MEWRTVQLKYELIRISEILQSWARFNKSPTLKEITFTLDDLKVEKMGYDQLEIIKDQLVTVILNSQDKYLIADTEWFIKSDDDTDNYQSESMVST